MESFLLSDKNNYDIEYLIQNFDAFFDTIDNILSKSKDDKNISKLCTKLVNIYKEKDSKLINLIINCIPYLIKYYFNYFYDDKICPIIEACILTIYNLSLNDENAKCNRIRVPNLSIASVYHNPQISATQSELTESALFKLESEHLILTDHFKPLNTINLLNYEKRILIIRYLLLFYYSKICFMSKQSKLVYIEMCIKVCKPIRNTIRNSHNHNNNHHNHNEKIQFYINSEILIEFLYCLNYLIYNGFSREAIRAIDTIAQKADDELFCDVILMCNSIKNSIELSNTELSDMNSSKNTLINSSPMIQKPINRQSAGTGSLFTCDGGTFKDNDENNDNDDFDSDYDLNRQSQILENSLNRVYIAPSAGERDAVRRASMKLKKAKQDMVNDENKKEINEFTKLDDIPIIDDSNPESGTNDESEDGGKQKKKERKNGVLY